jgi:hypothetical protein
MGKQLVKGITLNEKIVARQTTRQQKNRLAGLSLTFGLISIVSLVILILVLFFSIKFFDFMFGMDGENGRLAIFGICIKLEIPLALIGRTIAIILGFRALSQIRRFSQIGNGKAIIGIVLGFVSVVPLLTFVVIVLPMIGRMLDSVFSGFWN